MIEYNRILTDAWDPSLTPVEQIFVNRGFKLEDIPHYLHTTDDDLLDVALIDNIKDGAKLLISHIAAGDKILIQVDSDCDGYTSAAVLINYLYHFMPGYVKNCITYIIHEGKEHGIDVDNIPEEVKLVAALDSSSNEFEIHRQLKERGIDVLVIDHHEAEKVSPYACVINNQLCAYPNKTLSGVGMVYKFCSYLDKMLYDNYAEQLLDLVAMGMLADMMDVRNFETRHLIKKGLDNIINPFMKGMVEQESYSLGESITPTGIAFYIAPGVNATIRVGTQEEKMLLFESMLTYKAYELIPSTKRGHTENEKETIMEQACRNCRNIKSRQAKMRNDNLAVIERKIREQKLNKNKILVVQLNQDENISKNLTGLIANQLMSKYQKPVLILNQTNREGIVKWEGSGRGYAKSKLTDFKEFLNSTGLVSYAEGHANACGVGILDSNIRRFIDYSNMALRKVDFHPCYNVDFIIHAKDLKADLVFDIAGLSSYWGQGIEESLIAIEGVNVTSRNLLLMSPDKNPTLRISLPNGISVIKFKSSRYEYDSLFTKEGCITINLVGRCSINTWNGIVTPQIFMEDYEFVDISTYYF